MNAEFVAACSTRCNDGGLEIATLAKQEFVSVFAPDTPVVESFLFRLRPSMLLGLTDLPDLHRSFGKRPLTLQFRI
jgi:hypothetical protein